MAPRPALLLCSWAKALCVRHGAAIQAASGGALPALRALQKALARLHEDLAATCESNMCVCLPGAAGAASLCCNDRSAPLTHLSLYC